MKLRIKGHSLRLRLTQVELSRFAEAGRVEETLPFPGGQRLLYALQASDEVDHLAARFDGEEVTIFMPASWVQPWADTERVGFEGAQALEGGEELHLLVEKDFQCLHKRPDEQDAFPHPLADQAAASGYGKDTYTS